MNTYRYQTSINVHIDQAGSVIDRMANSGWRLSHVVAQHSSGRDNSFTSAPKYTIIFEREVDDK